MTNDSYQPHSLGEEGERLAAEHLKRLGFRIVATRARNRLGELDIVARDGDAWVFVEVKARNASTYGSAIDAYTSGKIRRFSKAVREYARTNGLLDCPLRCDAVTVDFMPGTKPKIVHMPGAIEIAE